MMIQDLTFTREVDATAVRGGFNANVGNINFALGGSVGSPAVVVAPVSQTDPYGYGANLNAGNLNAAIGGSLGSPAVVVAPVTQS